MVISLVKWPTSIAEICADDESAQKLHRQLTKSWLVKFPVCADGDLRGRGVVVPWGNYNNTSIDPPCDYY